MKPTLLTIGALLILFLNASCAHSPSSSKTTQTSVEKEIAITVAISTKGHDIAFDKVAIQVPFGSRVKLTYKNEAALDSEIVHNVAVLHEGKDAELLWLLKETEYDLEKVMASTLVMAKTRELNPGEEDTIIFTPPKRGYYTYICLMPGHGDVMGMKGIMRVN